MRRRHPLRPIPLPLSAPWLRLYSGLFYYYENPRQRWQIARSRILRSDIRGDTRREDAHSMHVEFRMSVRVRGEGCWDLYARRRPIYKFPKLPALRDVFWSLDTGRTGNTSM